MKKILVVLTILVLVAGFAFADVTGRVTAQYKFNFLNKTAGYSTPNNLAVELTLDSQAGGFTGEKYPYVKVEADAIITTDNAYDSATGEQVDEDYSDNLNWGWGMPTFWSRVRIKTFAIVGENWEVNLLKVAIGADYATDAIDSKIFAYGYDDQNTGAYTYRAPSFSFSAPVNNVYGVTVTYDGYKVAFGYNNANFDAENQSTILIGAETKAIELGEGLTAQAAASFKALPTIPNRTKAAAASAKVAYEADEVKASVAVDAGKISGDEKISFDVAVNVKYAPVTFDFYYATKADAYGYRHLATSKSDYGAPVEKLLSMKAVVALGDVVENVPVTLTATASNILNDSTANLDGKNYSVSVNTTAIENLDLTVYFKDMLKKADKGKNQQKLGAKAVYTGIENVKLTGAVSYAFGGKVLDASVAAEYTAELYKVAGTVAIEKIADADVLFGGVASISSDALVEGATLKAEFAWDANALIKDDETKAFTVSCAVKF